MNKKRIINHNRAPIFEALKKHIDEGIIPFHVPGHKGGKGIIEEFVDYVGEKIFNMDVNGMEDLDNACNPMGVIRKAEILMADLFGAQDSFFLVNGTTQGVQAMILHAIKPGDEIIIQRNAHRSTVGALILSGAIPIYINTPVNAELGISMGLEPHDLICAIKAHPNAKAVFVNNPTYYGMAPNLKEIIKISHDNHMPILADEAHGAHFPFHAGLPPSAMELGADLSAISLHKTGGAMTQASALLVNKGGINPYEVRTTLNLMQTTSASYILMASLDLARKHLALRGKAMMDRAIGLSDYARDRINHIEGLYAFGPELVGTPGVFDFDRTKLCICLRRLGISGYDTESILRKEYNIQVEMSDFYNVLAIVSLGDDEEAIDSLVEALKDIARRYGHLTPVGPTMVPPRLRQILSPRDAYYAPRISVPLDQSIGEISGEMVMAYPPGIPALCLGERITQEAVKYIKMMGKSGYQLQGMEDPDLNYIKVVDPSPCH